MTTETKDFSMATIKDVARRAEVSTATVSRVINKDPRVRPAIRRAVMEAIEQLGYQPNAVAQNLRRSSTQVLGMVQHNLRATLASRLVEGADSVAREEGFALFVASANDSLAIEEQRIRDFLGRRVDGLLCFPVGSSTLLREAARNTSTPTMLLGRHSADAELPTALTEPKAAFREVLDDLRGVGHERIAMISDLQSRPQGSNRLALFRRIVNQYPEFGAPLEGHVDTGTSTHDAVEALFEGPNPPTALIIANEHIGPACLRALRELKLSVPGDVSIVMFGHSEWAHAVEPELNTVGVDPYQYGREATTALIRLVRREPDAPKVIRHSYTYQRRGSVTRPGCPGAVTG